MLDLSMLEYFRSFGLNSERVLVFKIPCKTTLIYLCAGESLNDKYILFIEPIAYLNMWRRTDYQIHREIAYETKKEWMKYYNYGNIDKQMKASDLKPVYFVELYNANAFVENKRLPIIPFSFNENVVGISIKDGLTRSRWLLANNAIVIPVVCYSYKGATTIAHYTNSKVFSFEHLYKTADNKLN